MNLVANQRDGKISEMPGRRVYWMQTPETTGGQYNSLCTVIYEPGAKAKPAHAHDNGEETIFVVAGVGKVLVGDEIFDLEPNTSVLFPQGVPHMVWNTGNTPMHLACFYGPCQEAISYTFYEDVDFPEEMLAKGTP